MEKENYTEQQILALVDGIKTWKLHKTDLMYWMEHHSKESVDKWIDRHGISGCAEPGYVTYIMDEFAKWIICNIVF